MNKRFFSLIPLILLTALSAYAIITIQYATVVYEGEVHRLAFGLGHYLAFGFVPICWILYFLSRKWYVLLISTMLLLGAFSILSFAPSYNYWEFSFGGEQILKIIYEPYTAVIAAIHLLANAEGLAGLFPSD